MKKNLILTMAFIFTTLNAFSQKSDNGEATFKPNGKPLVTIFSDFRYNVQDGKTNPAFEISRAYFGYMYNFNPHFSTKILFDVTSSNNSTNSYPSAFSTYIKNAYGEYSNESLKIDFGMIGTNTFNIQEAMWGKRYLLKSFQDLNGYSSSADLGVSIKYQIMPKLSFDAQIVNGEGYQKVQADSTVKVAAGLTYEPIKNLFIRIYGDYMKKDIAQKTFNAFIGYTGKDITLAGEYNIQKGNKMVDDHNLSGASFWGTYKTSKTVSLFARYDYLTSNTVSGASSHWNVSKDGQLYVAGLEIFPVKGMAIAPNIQYTNPKLSSLKSTTSYLVNFNFSF